MTHKEMTERMQSMQKQLELMDRIIKGLEARIFTLENKSIRFPATPVPVAPFPEGPWPSKPPTWFTTHPQTNPQDAFR